MFNVQILGIKCREGGKENLDLFFFLVCLTGDTVFVHGAAATPLPLLESLANHGKSANLKDVELIHIHTEGPGVCQQPEYHGGCLTENYILKH